MRKQVHPWTGASVVQLFLLFSLYGILVNGKLCIVCFMIGIFVCLRCAHRSVGRSGAKDHLREISPEAYTHSEEDTRSM